MSRHTSPTSTTTRRAAALVGVGLLAAGSTALIVQPASAATPSVDAFIDGFAQLKVLGTRNADDIVLRLQQGDPNILEVDTNSDGLADYSFDRALFDQIFIAARGGDDTITMDESRGAFTDTENTVMHGENGADRLLGGSGAELMVGGRGPDFIDGNRGNDIGVMGGGDDVFQWDPGDGSDVIEGDGGYDTMLFNGAAAAEVFDYSANGGRLRFFRNLGNIVMDTGSVEDVALNALGGADVITVNDLAATDVVHTGIDLAPAIGGTTGDGAIDRIVANADGAALTVTGAGTDVQVTGMAPTIDLANAEPTDELALDGAAAVDSTGLTPGTISLLVDGVPA